MQRLKAVLRARPSNLLPLVSVQLPTSTQQDPVRLSAQAYNRLMYGHFQVHTVDRRNEITASFVMMCVQGRARGAKRSSGGATGTAAELGVVEEVLRWAVETMKAEVFEELREMMGRTVGWPVDAEEQQEQNQGGKYNEDDYDEEEAEGLGDYQYVWLMITKYKQRIL